MRCYPASVIIQCTISCIIKFEISVELWPFSIEGNYDFHLWKDCSVSTLHFSCSLIPGAYRTWSSEGEGQSRRQGKYPMPLAVEYWLIGWSKCFYIIAGACHSHSAAEIICSSASAECSGIFYCRTHWQLWLDQQRGLVLCAFCILIFMLGDVFIFVGTTCIYRNCSNMMFRSWIAFCFVPLRTPWLGHLVKISSDLFIKGPLSIRSIFGFTSLEHHQLTIQNNECLHYSSMLSISSQTTCQSCGRVSEREVSKILLILLINPGDFYFSEYIHRAA